MSNNRPTCLCISDILVRRAYLLWESNPTDKNWADFERMHAQRSAELVARMEKAVAAKTAG